MIAIIKAQFTVCLIKYRWGTSHYSHMIPHEKTGEALTAAEYTASSLAG